MGGGSQGVASAVRGSPRDDAGVCSASDRCGAELAVIWQGVLKLDRVGVQDNFFELGGDSILAIQVIARAHRAGLVLTPRQFFERPTVEGMAGVVVRKESKAPLHLEATGKVPLLPIQRWLLGGESPNPAHFNQYVMVEVPTGLRCNWLKNALSALVDHHDALRYRYGRLDGRWIQQVEKGAAADYPPWKSIYPMARPKTGHSAWQVKLLAPNKDSIWSGGPLLRAVLFRQGGGDPDRLLLVGPPI